MSDDDELTQPIGRKLPEALRYPNRFERTVRVILHVVSIVLLALLIYFLLAFSVALSRVGERIGEPGIIGPAPTYTGDPFGEDQGEIGG